MLISFLSLISDLIYRANTLVKFRSYQIYEDNEITKAIISIYQDYYIVENCKIEGSTLIIDASKFQLV